jgi:hypothetical protein
VGMRVGARPGGLHHCAGLKDRRLPRRSRQMLVHGLVVGLTRLLIPNMRAQYRVGSVRKVEVLSVVGETPTRIVLGARRSARR